MNYRNTTYNAYGTIDCEDFLMNYRNTTYNAYGTIDCEVEHPVHGWIPFTAAPDDIEQVGVDLYNELVSAGNIAAFVPPADIVGDLALSRMRNERDIKLTQDVDPIVSNALRWNELSAEKQQEWEQYRRDLLDMTTTNPSPVYSWNTESLDLSSTNFTWPVRPV